MAAERQLTPFELGQIKALMHHALGCRAIADIVDQPGAGHWGHTPIASAMTKLIAGPKRRGDRNVGSGRKRNATTSFDRKVAREAVEMRGARAGYRAVPAPPVPRSTLAEQQAL